MDAFVNEIFEKHFSGARNLKWLNFDVFATEWKKEIKSNVEASIRYNFTFVNMEMLACPLISDEMDPGADGCFEAYDCFDHDIPEDVIAEYASKNPIKPFPKLKPKPKSKSKQINWS